MAWPLRWLVVALTVVAPALPQSIYLYRNSTSDGTYLYSTAVLQYGAPLPCMGMCSAAYHNYAQGVTITSPTGRTASCSGSTGGPAASNANLQCEASIPINDEFDGYTSTQNANATCSQVGTIMTVLIPLQLSLAFTTVETVNEPMRSVCQSNAACTNTLTPRCGAQTTVIETDGGNCHPFHYCGFIAARYGGAGPWTCTQALCSSIAGPGYCTPQ